MKNVVTTLVIVTVVVFLFTGLINIPVPERLLKYLYAKGKTDLVMALRRYGLFITFFSLFPVFIRESGWVWQVFTYMFLHGSLLHLFFNMYALYLFGRPLEERWGGREFLFFYLTTGIGAGIVTFFWNLVKNPFIPTVGASGAIFGIVLAFGLEFPDSLLLLFFVIPVRAKYAAFIFGGLELVMLLTGSIERIGHFTHLAGLFFGYIYYLLIIKNRYSRNKFALSGRLKRAIALRMQRISEEKKNIFIEMSIAIKDKLGKGLELDRREAILLSRLKGFYDKNSIDICEPDEFEPSANDCKDCDSFYSCIYRFIMYL